jgi:DNA-binding HxlR family transcriptional regulator
LAANRVNGSGKGARSGAQTLILLAAPLNVPILRSLADGPEQLSDLRRDCGLPAQTTLRAQLKRLAELGTVEKRRRDRFPGVLEYELTGPGREMLDVARALEGWLDRAPDGPLQLGGNAAKAAIKALAEGWSTTMLRALAARPLSLTELDRVIAPHSYPTLERRLSALRLAGLAEARESNGRGTPYAVSHWLRQGITPLVSAVRWERRHLGDVTAPLAAIDIEAMFLLAVPLLRPPSELAGSCRMGAEVQNGRKSRLAGVVMGVEGGTVVTCSTNLSGRCDGWALGSVSAWLAAVVEADFDGLELGGNCGLARGLLSALNASLFAAPANSI